MRRGRRSLLPIVLCLSVSACAGSASASPTPSEPSLFEGARAWSIVADQMALGPRIPGSEAHRRVGDLIGAHLSQAGWEVEFQPFEYQGQSFRNVIGRGPAADAPLVIVGAHYDTRPIADRNDPPALTPVPGANDGASGVAVLLELARSLSGVPLEVQVWLAFFDAEDGGGAAGGEWILGSRHFADALRQVPAAVVVVDMVGDADLRLPYEQNSDLALVAQIWEMGRRLGYPAFVLEPGPALIDDHAPFLERGIPAIDIIDFDYPFWHTTDDTLDKISAESLEQVGRTLHAWLTDPRLPASLPGTAAP